MAAQRDYYQVLGVAETATTDEIKKAFRRLAKLHHPDRNPNNPQAAERFKEINEAHDVLSDVDKRKKYDQLRRYGAFAGPSGGGFHPRSGGSARRGRTAPDESGDFDISDLGGLGDIFSSIFGRRGAGGRDAEPEEIETSVTIPFRVAALGGAIPITLTMPEVCPTCGGNGAAKGATVNTCPECKGRGTVSFGQGGFAVNRPCPVCRGKGTVPSQPCPTCKGAGEVRIEKRVNVEIPAGVEDGARLRLKNQGPKGRGDLMVQIQIAPDRFFRREGLDLIGVVPINLAQALLGSRIKVKTLDDKRVVLRIPAGTQHGQKFRVPGHGIEKNGRRGDMYVEAHVTLPEKLSPEEQEAVKSFADKTGMKY
ncbi:MAG TPA: DnaJ C-terminal domain-containing protein [Gemmatimonadales bacterium]|nr:DnaJ C-terminal domain-containing protein [Gemmatimonadales bacterium]